MSVKLSAVIITFNEEKNIERCLNSLNGIADEIIVLDSFSTDRTKEICMKFNVRFFEHDFDGYIEQKNRALHFTSYEWVLSLDADEALSNELAKEIKKVKENPDADGYTFNRLNYYCGKWIRHSGWYPDKKLRLWNKIKGKWAGVNPHDKLMLEPGSKIRHLKGDLLHYTYYSVQEHIDQINKFSSIGAAEAFKKGKNSNAFIILIKSSWRFFRDYVINLGFLDGYYGFVICSLSGWGTFLKYLKLRELKKQHI
jgi:glycosyltransferase involved in cell wall biosynthesis